MTRIGGGWRGSEPGGEDLHDETVGRIDRRRFLSAAVAFWAAGRTLGREPLRVLMLGGTGFLGPTIVDVFRQAGHTVTLFNRGVTAPDLFPDLELLVGDRERADGAGYAALAGREWDVVVDTWQRAPQCVLDAATALRGRVGQYQYVSSIAVYDDLSAPGIDEDASVHHDTPLPPGRTVSLPYSRRKILGENAVRRVFADRHLVVRSHGMRGVHVAAVGDEPYWPARIARGGDVLAPGDGTTPIQFTDIVALCRFQRSCAERGVGGTFNVATPMHGHTLADYLTTIARVTGSGARLRWLPRDFLAEHDIEPYRDLPMWRPEPAGFYGIDCGRAEAAGFETRPLEEPIRDMLAGYRARHPDDGFRFGATPHEGTISMETERAVLAAWEARSRGSECQHSASYTSTPRIS